MTMTTPNSSGSGNPYKTKHGFGSGAAFAPSFGVNVNVTSKQPSGSAGAAANPGVGMARSGQLALPEPAFYSTADVRTYCEGVRAFGAYAAIEIEVAAEILKAALEQAKGVPGDNIFQSKMRARAVAKKLSKAADAFTDAAKDAAAAWAAFQREYAQMGAARPPVQRRPFQF
ncbi:plasmid transfer protein TraA [Kitasatospora sp. NBC_01287]|uniref:plasmid transfer protein TraA n=1 Tax=Kitasatospora sp. NBC_01287 TaxID=2903573 RepID=UPI00225744D4|nr:plasmid transfer protein TraA [Kitasatospora sp. NBC_01287]MCX4752012.1 plasmid transfer protein TraA [Kitasatospora sp. NBC_01287]